MNSIHRVGLTVAGLVAVASLSGAFVVQGYFAAQQAAAQSAPQMAALASPTDAQIVYVRPPVPVPPVPTDPPQQPQVIHVIVPSAGDDDGGADS